jgi:hypothetical protein
MPTFRALLTAARMDARRWWYHQDLRKQGKTQEARTREHETTRRNVYEIRKAQRYGGLLKVGRYGASFFYAPDVHVSGCHPGIIELATLCGIPVVDSRTVPEEWLVRFAFSMPTLELNPKYQDPDYSWGSASRVTPALYIALAREWGATITNDPGSPLPAGLPECFLPPTAATVAA